MVTRFGVVSRRSASKNRWYDDVCLWPVVQDDARFLDSSQQQVRRVIRFYIRSKAAARRVMSMS